MVLIRILDNGVRRVRTVSHKTQIPFNCSANYLLEIEILSDQSIPSDGRSNSMRITKDTTKSYYFVSKYTRHNTMQEPE